MRQGIASKLKNLRQAKHLTQLEMAAKLNITKRTLQNIEYGMTDPSFGFLENFAGVIGITVPQLISYDESSYFNNVFYNEGNKGTNIQQQNASSSEMINAIEKLSKALTNFVSEVKTSLNKNIFGNSI